MIFNCVECDNDYSDSEYANHGMCVSCYSDIRLLIKCASSGVEYFDGQRSMYTNVTGDVEYEYQY